VSLSSLFPQPKRVIHLGPAFATDDLRIDVESPSDDPLIRSARALIEPLAGAGERTYRIDVQIGEPDPSWPDGAARDEAYTLELRPDGGTLSAATAAGVFLGCQTLRHLIRGGDLPAARIVDWPDLRFRGLYIESKWGPDLMTLADWQEMIDALAALKFNSIGIGVYGCWVVQYGGKRTEFLMLPFPDHPDLVTPKTLRYYSPKAGDWQTLDYLPAMVTDDLFGQIVAYAKERNVIVRPHFNSPGHNTLIPRVYPEISSRDEQGEPIGYGFCLSNPKTYEVLFDLYDSVIERYLRPNGIEWFHIGLDEVEAYQGIDEDDPSRLVDPWCRCPECRDKPHGRQLQEYAVKVCAHLKEQGITQITMWNDALDGLSVLDEEFARMIAEAGLRENVIVQWWRYHEPVLIPRTELGLRAWSTPMAGYWSNLFTHSSTANIYPMLLHGGRAGIEGADAYCIYDPAYDRNYACLAEYSWNQPGADDLYAFKSRYARAKLGDRLGIHGAAEAFDSYDQAFDSMPWTNSTVFSLLYYWHTYPAARARGLFPRDVITDLRSSHLRLRNGLAGAAAHAQKARDLFTEALTHGADPILAEYRVECEKLTGVWEAYATVLDAVGIYDATAETGRSGTEAAAIASDAAERVRRGRDRFEAVMADQEQVKKAYLLPQTLRDMSIALLYFERLAEALKTVALRIEAGEADYLPPFGELEINNVDLDREVAG
jgi:hypothetical protein